MEVQTFHPINGAGNDKQSLIPELQNSIKAIIETEKYITHEVSIKQFDTSGNNFAGKLYEVDIMGETSGGNKETNIFVKQRIEFKKVKIISLCDVYSKEVLLYKDLSKIFTSLQDQANVPQDDRYKIAKAYDETNENFIIMENLARRGFKTSEKAESVSVKYAELAVQELAKFHAVSFVIENKIPDYFNTHIKDLKNPFFFDDDWRGLIKNVIAHVDSLYEDSEVKQKIENFLPVMFEKFPKYCNNQTTVKCTLTHGDYKTNNLLVRVEDGEPKEIVPVDYQFIHYGCPIKDLLFFLISATDRDMRKKHLNDLKDMYFQTLSRFLKYFNLDVETVYPRVEFEKVYKEWLDYGLMMTLMAAFVMYAPDTGFDLANMNSLRDIPFCPDKKYDHIFRGLVDDFIEWECL